MKGQFYFLQTQSFQVKNRSKKFSSQNSKGLLLLTFELLLFCLISFAQQDKSKDEFKPSGKLWGYAFGDFYYKLGGAKAAGADSFYVTQGDTAIKAKRWGDAEFAQKAKDYYAFTFRRIYLGYDYNFTENISSRILLESNDGVTTSAGDRTVFIKALYLEWKNIFKNQTLKLGQISTPSWPTFTEPLWAYRSIEKTLPDFRKLSRSNDVGIGLSGTLADIKSIPIAIGTDTTQKPKPLFKASYNLVYGNGTASKPENANRMKVYYGEIIFKFSSSILLEGFAEYEPNSVMIVSGGKAGQSMNTSKTLFRGFAGYEHEFFTVGIELVQNVVKNSKLAIAVDSATSSKKDTMDWKQMGLSFWARGTIIKDKLYAFARYDMFNPDADLRGWEYYTKVNEVKKYNETFLVVGLDWHPAKNVQVMPNLWLNSYKDMTTNVSNYKEIKRESDVVPRVTLFYKF